MGVVEAAKKLRDRCEALRFPDVAYVYDPLLYAWEPHARYAEAFGRAPKRAIFVGMNPGPHGMAQTGVPFGDVGYVRDWMGITGAVEQPPRVHPKRPVKGFATTRREPSGSRLYGWAKERFGTAEEFFSDFFILNYCPLLFYDEAGKNLTPPQLRQSEMKALYAACDDHVVDVAKALRPEWLVGVGAFAQEQLRVLVETRGLPVKVGGVLHPSPASPAANRGWAQQAEAQLAAMRLL